MTRLSGISAIIFGLILLVFPWFGLWTLSAILGFILVLVGVGLLMFGAFTYHASKDAAIAFLILGVLGLIAGVGMFGNVSALSALVGFALYLSAGILIISGLVHVFKPRYRFAREVGVVGVLLGVVYLILGSLSMDPRDLSVLMGIWLVIVGLVSLF